MIKKFIFLCVCIVFLFVVQPTFAADVTPTPTDTTTPTPTPAQLDQKTAASSIIQNITNFIVNLDSQAGGFIFSTPEDLFKNTVHLKNGTTIDSLNTFRMGFVALSVGIVALLILYVGGSNMIEGKISFLKSFFLRIIFYVVLLTMLPLFLTTTIQISNALTNAILQAPAVSSSDQQKNTDFTSFITDYYNKGNNQIADGTSKPEDIGVATVGWTNFFQSVSNASMMLFIMVVSFIALILGLLFIVTQFALRFLSLLFLSLIFPLVSPFVLTEKTQGIFSNYLKIWFTFLIHQPAFALGYTIVMLIVRSMLSSQGASLGVLYLYIASLFFLGTVNVLAARIFADAWVALGANFESAMLSGMATKVGFVAAAMGWKNRDKIVAGAKNMGRSIQEGLDHVSSPRKQAPNFAYASPVQNAEYGGSMLNPGIRGGVDTIYANPSSSYTPPSINTDTPSMPVSSAAAPKYAGEFSNKGFTVDTVDNKKGIYAVSGTGYSYYDEKNNLTHTFPSKQDALDSGYKESQIQQTPLTKQYVIDASQQGKMASYNASATKKAMHAGHDSNYAHVTGRSDAIRIKHNMELNQERLNKNGIQGYVVRHFDNPNGAKSSKRATTRIITLGRKENV